MGTECIESHLKGDATEIPLVPPGFVSLTSFTLRRINEDVMKSNCMDSMGASDSCQTRMDHELPINDDVKLTRTLRRRPWINYSVFDNSSDEESDSEHLDQDFSSMRHLPKGVIRGCMECSNCQKVTARWQPENARRPKLDGAPVFHPTEEEFEDTLKYIASIRPVAEPYGICRIVPPPSWNPPCPLKEKDMWENAKFSTRIQRIDKLQNRNSMRKMSKYYFHINRKRRRLKQGMESKNSNGDMAETNPPESLNFNERFGFEPGPQFTLEAFEKYADDFKKQYFCMKDIDMNSTSNQDELRKQQPTIENIEGEYWRLVEKPTEEIEVLYGADIETRVFGSGFPRASATAMKSALKNRYVKSGWNLNNFSRLPGSMLSFESGDISGVLVPWLYVGMCFSSFCWHVEDHHLYSMNYMHWGAPKVWYGVPGKDALKLEAAMKKNLPDLFEEQPDLLHKLVTQLSPSILKCEGVPVYRCVQHPGEFVLTFPQAYHSGFNCGFNCAEAVNVAPVDWLPHGQNAIELYRDQGRKTTVSHDKLLLGAAGEAVRAQWELQLLSNSTADNLRWKDVCGMNGILTKALKTRVEMERVRREYLCSLSQSQKMDACFDATSERECIFCFYDLHLSAVGCKCSLDRFACLSHANKFCSCAWSEKFFLFRYEIGELNILVEALGGKLSAIYRWAHQYLGLSLSSHVNKEKLRDHQSPSKPSLGGIKQNEHASVNVVCFSGVANSSTLCQETNGFMPKKSSLQQAKEREERVPNAVKSTSTIANAFSIQKLNPSLAMSTFEDGIDIHTQKRKETLDSEGLIVQYRTSNGIVVDQMSQCKEGCLTPDANLLNLPVCQLSQEDISYAEHSETTSSEQNSRGFSLSVPGGKSPTSILETKEMKTSDVILLSDDEGEDSRVSLMATTAEESVLTHHETSMMLPTSDDSATPCNYQMNAVTSMSETNPSAMNGQDVSLIPETEKGGYISYSAHIKAEEPGRDENHFQCDLMAPNDTVAGSLPEEIWCNVNSIGLPSEQQISNFSSLENSGNFDGANFGIHPQNNQLHGIVELNIESKDEKPILESGMILKDRAQKPAMGGISNSLDRCYRQKGPRIAKVVRKFNCTVEPLEYGVVFSGRSWSNSQAIFPKGFRSRVKYWSILDPMKMCYYVSEILDAGLLGPLFMVKVESCPGEVFIHVSAAKCWDMVRERVNHEIRRQHNLGRAGLPPPQPPGCLDGLEMFGFSTPAIIQAIEAIDHGHICLEYWKSRPETKDTQYSLFGNSTGDIGQRIKEQSHDQEVNNAEVKHPMPPGRDTVLRGLFKKANLEELHSLHKILSSDRWCSNQVLIQFLDEEIQSRLPSNLPGLR